MSLGKKLSGYRRDAGYTQQQLGDLLNVSAQAVSKWENDQAEPDLQMLRRLCLIYKIMYRHLFPVPYFWRKQIQRGARSPNGRPAVFYVR